jgi:hypothetical protein
MKVVAREGLLDGTPQPHQPSLLGAALENFKTKKYFQTDFFVSTML